MSECKGAENTGVLQISPEDQCDWEELSTMGRMEKNTGRAWLRFCAPGTMGSLGGE